jgi:hypothetical protein
MDIYSINSRACGKVERKREIDQKAKRWFSSGSSTPTSWVHELKTYPPSAVEKKVVINRQKIITLIHR